MSTHNIGCYGEISNIILYYHKISYTHIFVLLAVSKQQQLDHIAHATIVQSFTGLRKIWGHQGRVFVRESYQKQTYVNIRKHYISNTKSHF